MRSLLVSAELIKKEITLMAKKTKDDTGQLAREVTDQSVAARSALELGCVRQGPRSADICSAT